MSTTPKRPLTCFYWKNGKCKNSDDECKYLHIDTERVATGPKKQGVYAGESSLHVIALTDLTTGQYRPATDDSDDLISLISRSNASERRRHQHRGGAFISAALIANAITSRESLTFVENLFTGNPESAVKEALLASDDRAAAIFTAIEYNRGDLVKLLLRHGADPNATGQTPQMPALAFAIINKNPTTNTMVSLLLSYGANPATIPKDLWDGKQVASGDTPIPPDAEWCKEPQKALLSRRITISIKYRLQQASKASPLRLKQFDAKLRPLLQPVAQAEHFLVGQKIAIEKVKNYLVTHLLSGHGNPLVMVFAGPPGHGKSSFARLMGNFVPVSSLVKHQNPTYEDDTYSNPTRCTQDNSQGDSSNGLTILFVDGADEANLYRLATFLGDDSDFGYLTHGVRKPIDRSKTVCIISTTEGERILLPFYTNYIDSSSEDSWASAPWGFLDKSLRNEVVSRIPRLISRYIGPIVPFMPFSKTEAITLTHGFITKAFDALVKSYASITPVQTGQPNVHSMIYADEQTCSYIAKASYDITFGARSIEQAVFKDVQIQMVERFVEESDLNAAHRGASHEMSAVVVGSRENGVSVTHIRG